MTTPTAQGAQPGSPAAAGADETRKLGEILVEQGVLTQTEVETALENQLVYGGRLGTNLVELGRWRLDDIGQALAIQHGVPLVDAAAVEALQPEALEFVSTEDCEKFGIIPLKVDEAGRLFLGMRDPLSFHIEGLSKHLGRELVPMAMPEMRLHYLLERFYGIPRAKRFLRLPDGGENNPRQRSYLGATVRPATGDVAMVAPSPQKKEERDKLATRVLVAPVARTTAEVPLPNSILVPPRALPDGDASQALDEAPANLVYLDQLSRDRTGRDADFELEEADLEFVADRRVEAVVEELDATDRGGEIARLLVVPLFEGSGLSVLFWVRGTHAVACCAQGAPATDRRVQQLSVGLDKPSAFQWAMKLRGVIRVDGTHDATQYQIASFLTTALPQQVCVVPVFLRGKVVNLICIHSLPRTTIPHAVVNDLRDLAEAASRAYERLRGVIQRT